MQAAWQLPPAQVAVHITSCIMISQCHQDKSHFDLSLGQTQTGYVFSMQDLPSEDQRQLLLSVPFMQMSHILQALPGQACMDALVSIGAPLCKDLLLSMPSAASRKLLHAASTADLAKFIKVGLPVSSPLHASMCEDACAPRLLVRLWIH